MLEAAVRTAMMLVVVVLYLFSVSFVVILLSYFLTDAAVSVVLCAFLVWIFYFFMMVAFSSSVYLPFAFPHGDRSSPMRGSIQKEGTGWILKHGWRLCQLRISCQDSVMCEMMT